jgi:hypothetical protein
MWRFARKVNMNQDTRDTIDKYVNADVCAYLSSESSGLASLAELACALPGGAAASLATLI